MPAGHYLEEWREHTDIQLEVFRAGSKVKLYGFRVRGADVTRFMKDGLWEEAEDYCERCLGDETPAETTRATVRMNRPDKANAMNLPMWHELRRAFTALDETPSVRVVVLAASGRSFSAGANLNWMKRMAGYSEAQNVEDALGLARLMHALYTFRKPTLARVHGPAFAGGLGLVACCDIAVAAPEATFCLTEVRLGMIPAVITPYVVAAIGERQARRYCLTAEKFDAAEALRLGLVHEVVEAAALDARIDALAGQLLLQRTGGCASPAVGVLQIRSSQRFLPSASRIGLE
jgi:methylglutaconyl-CoA hydratase